MGEGQEFALRVAYETYVGASMRCMLRFEYDAAARLLADATAIMAVLAASRQAGEVER